MLSTFIMPIVERVRTRATASRFGRRRENEAKRLGVVIPHFPGDPSKQPLFVPGVDALSAHAGITPQTAAKQNNGMLFMKLNFKHHR